MNCISLKSLTRRILSTAVGALVLLSPLVVMPSTAVDPLFLDFSGPLREDRAEVSGLCWNEDLLVVLPEDPAIFGREGMLGLFTIDKEAIEAKISGQRPEPLDPALIDGKATRLIQMITGFDGLEAIGMMDNRVYCTAEARVDTVMAAYLLTGRTSLVNDQLVVELTHRSFIPLDSNIFNVAEESIVIDGRRVITISEVNGANVRPDPVAQVFNASGNFLTAMPFPQIEYRVTDATALDDEGRFWVINYFYPGERDKLKPAADPERAKFGTPENQPDTGCVERLLELQLTRDNRIIRTETPPIYLQLDPAGCRNWEGIVRLDERGFLLMTDKYPGTLLAFVPNPFKE